jgi:N-acetylglucosaminyldiphosphoundecaprenol N-acetyl-beta-D-mannosaminyltransferase
MIKKVPVLNFPIAACSRELAAHQVGLWAMARDRAYGVAAADVHVIARASHDPDYAAKIRRFDLILPDGMPLVWEINSQLEEPQKLRQRVSGADLMRLTLGLGNEAVPPVHFLLGGSEKLLADLQHAIRRDFPDAFIGAAYSPPFGVWPDDEFERISSQIKACGATHVWVGLGCPKQEVWIGSHLDRLPPAVYFAVGAAFAFLAGHVKRAPDFFQKNGLEWFYRICCEPRRLWKRYFVYNSLFIFYWLKHRRNEQ